MTNSPRRSVSTVVASAGRSADDSLNSVAPPIWGSDTFRWEDHETKPAYDYSRTVNPNRDMLAKALAELEGACGGVVTNSGQSAALLALFLLGSDARVVAPNDCYGGTYRLLEALRDQGKLRVRFVDMLQAEGLDSALDDGADLVWIETPSNPLLRITDIAAVATRAKAAGALVLADNTLLTPCLQRPIELGCDLVMHSTTKALNGHNDLFGGALLAASEDLLERIAWWANAAGLSGSAYDASQILRGLRTLPLRISRQTRSAADIAVWLEERSEVSSVHYPGLENHPQHELAGRQQDGAGFVISFRLIGGADATRRFLAGLRLVQLASSLGGFVTLICCPSTMTHRGMPEDAQRAAGIAPDLLRLSVGLEDLADIIADLKSALTGL